jgi:hypothetical protein
MKDVDFLTTSYTKEMECFHTWGRTVGKASDRKST